MNFKMKTLAVAAIAAMAMSGAAEARIQDGTTGNSELVFSAWDGAVGYTLDLNTILTLNDLVAGGAADGLFAVSPPATVAASLIGSDGVIFDQLLTNFVGFNDLGNVQWNLAAGDSISRYRFLTTLGDSAADMNISNNNIKNAVTAFNGYVGGANGKSTDNVTMAVDGYANTVLADGVAYAGNMGDNWAGKVNDTTSLLGASTSLWVLGMNNSSTTGIAGSTTGYINQLMTFDGRAVSASTYLADDGYHLRIAADVAAVPEADTWAMMLAGLGLMGFIARRRTQA
jgi:uncharacterized protein YjbJ (UPF0337 family)